MAPGALPLHSASDMVTHMKTTIDIADSLLQAAKDAARRERTTLRSLVEEGLRLVLDRHRAHRRRFRLRDASVGGHGLQSESAGGGWPLVRARIYEGRGE